MIFFIFIFEWCKCLFKIPLFNFNCLLATLGLYFDEETSVTSTFLDLRWALNPPLIRTRSWLDLLELKKSFQSIFLFEKLWYETSITLWTKIKYGFCFDVAKSRTRTCFFLWPRSKMAIKAKNFNIVVGKMTFFGLILKKWTFYLAEIG